MIQVQPHVFQLISIAAKCTDRVGSSTRELHHRSGFRVPGDSNIELGVGGEFITFYRMTTGDEGDEVRLCTQMVENHSMRVADAQAASVMDALMRLT